MRCPVCGTGNLVRECRDLDYTYASRTTTIRQSGDFCDSCGEGIFSMEESAEYLAMVNQFRTKVDAEPLAPAEIKRIRNKLGLTQREAGDLFGGGIRAFSQYERGETKQGKALDKLLRLLDAHPYLLTGRASEEVGLKAVPAEEISRIGATAKPGPVLQDGVKIIPDKKQRYVLLSEERYTELVVAEREARFARVQASSDAAGAGQVKRGRAGARRR